MSAHLNPIQTTVALRGPDALRLLAREGARVKEAPGVERVRTLSLRMREHHPDTALGHLFFDVLVEGQNTPMVLTLNQEGGWTLRTTIDSPVQPVEVARTLVLSTAHITRELSELLNSPDDLPFTSIPTPHGARVFVGTRGADAFPFPMRAAVELARRHGCEWLEYDCDGPVIHGMTVYDWEDAQ